MSSLVNKDYHQANCRCWPPAWATQKF